MGKNILITGASGNLGKASVEKFLKQGYTVLATVTPGKVLGYNTVRPVNTFEADLTVEQDVENVIRKIIGEYQTLEAAILTVGGFSMGNIDVTDGAAIQKMITLNFNTAYFVARPVFRQMLAQQHGRIILVGAKPALEADAGKNSIAYALSKTLIFKLAELLNAEGNVKNVFTSVIVPNIIDTPSNRAAMPTADFSKWLSPEKIADTIFSLTAGDTQQDHQPIVKLY